METSQSNAQAPPSSPTDPAAPQNLGRRTFSGMIWLTLQTLGSKVATTGSTLLLAKFLVPKDFGVVGMALTVSSFASLIQQAGLNEILVQRGRHFARWANVAFWMSLTLSVLAAAIMMCLAPMAAHMYKAPGLVGLIAVAALTTAVGGLSVVPMARLQFDLRFRTVALIWLCLNVGQAGVSVILAMLKFGPYSLLLPRLILVMTQTVVLWPMQTRFIKLNPQWRRWKFMLADSTYIILTWFFYMITSQGDYISLGLRWSAEVVGIYYFGFNLSVQMNTLFTQNVMAAMLPALSTLQHDPPRQYAAFLGAARGLALVGMPFGFLMVALASPGVHLLFAPKWYPCVGVIQALGVGMAISMVGGVSISLLQARGEFRKLMFLTLYLSILFVTLVVPAVFIGGAQSVAIAVGMFHLIYGPSMLYTGVKSAGGSWRDVARIYGPATVCGVLGIGAATALAQFLPTMPGRNLVQILFIGTIGLTFYGLLIWRIAPAEGAELLSRITVLKDRLPWMRQDRAASAAS